MLSIVSGWLSLFCSLPVYRKLRSRTTTPKEEPGAQPSNFSLGWTCLLCAPDLSTAPVFSVFRGLPSQGVCISRTLERAQQQPCLLLGEVAFSGLSFLICEMVNHGTLLPSRCCCYCWGGAGDPPSR